MTKGVAATTKEVIATILLLYINMAAMTSHANQELSTHWESKNFGIHVHCQIPTVPEQTSSCLHPKPVPKGDQITYKHNQTSEQYET